MSPTPRQSPPPHPRRVHQRDAGLRTAKRITILTAASGLAMTGGLAVLSEHAFSGVRTVTTVAPDETDPIDTTPTAPAVTDPVVPATETATTLAPAADTTPAVAAPTPAGAPAPTATAAPVATAPSSTTVPTTVPAKAPATPPTTAARHKHHAPVVSGGS